MRYRVLLLAVLLVGLLSVMFVVSMETVSADTSVTITITALGVVVGAPTGFTVWYITDHEIGMSWTKPVGAVNTMVRAEYGQYPDEPAPGAQPTDGYLVYYGPATTASDTAVSLDEIATAVYYRAWSQNGAGVWSSNFGEGSQEGIGVTFLALIIATLGLLAIFAFTRLAVISFLDAVFWIVLGVFCYTKSTQPSTGNWDIYYAMFFVGCFFGLVCIFLPLVVRPSKAIDKGDIYVDDIDQGVLSFEDSWDRASGGRLPRVRRGHRPPPRQPPQPPQSDV